MNWIKQNPFLAALGGGTLVGAIVLIAIGLAGSGRYQEQLETFQASSQQVSSYEAKALYPDPALRDAKRKLLTDYSKEIEQLQEAFAPYRVEELDKISAQDFTDRLVAANDGVRKAFTEAGVGLPEGFYVGFESYSAGSLAREASTPILNYQLGAVNELLLMLARSGPSELKNLHRPPLPEESGGSWERQDNQAARELPLEITFRASEEATRKFLTELAGSGKYFYVIRTVRVSSEKATPPLSADAKFEAPAAEPAAAPAADPFGGFIFPDEEAPAPAEEPDATEEEAPAEVTPEPAPAGSRVIAEGDTSRILGQVLGTEQVNVFLRLDILQFLAPIALPQP
jgi:hypothetical protein